MYSWLWKYLLAMVIASVGLFVCVVVQNLFYVDLRYVSLAFMLATITILIIMVIKIRKMFDTQAPAFGERTWRSYR